MVVVDDVVDRVGDGPKSVAREIYGNERGAQYECHFSFLTR